MINSLLLITALISQVSMDKIIHEQPAIKTVVQEKTITNTVYVYTDKFGVDHADAVREIARKSAQEGDLKPFVMNDINGVTWEHPDKQFLEKWIESRNRQIDFQRQQPFTTILRQSVLGINCGPVG